MTPNYIYTFDLTAWGWIHLLIGLALVAIGICLLLGQGWAQVAGIVVAAISALINFTWLPYSPLWAILVIAVDLLIIWALASARAQAKAANAPQQAGSANGQLTRRRLPHRPVACHPETWPDGRSSLVRPPGLVRASCCCRGDALLDAVMKLWSMPMSTADPVSAASQPADYDDGEVRVAVISSVAWAMLVPR